MIRKNVDKAFKYLPNSFELFSCQSARFIVINDVSSQDHLDTLVIN